MLFNSYIFIFVFLPVTFATYFLVAKYLKVEAAISFLVLASLFFYAWWNPVYLIFILCSILINYLIGEAIVNQISRQRNKKAKYLLILGLSINIGFLAYFKYANFIIENINTLLNIKIQLDNIILPLAISFFTFQQIAYLIDAYKGITKEFKFMHYALFVTFFPQLIAGPIVHHKEMLPQFMDTENLKPNLINIMVGLIIFSLGLFKKVVFADSIAQYATPVFEQAADGTVLTALVAWGGALAYTCQLYFDFSGYSDMAIGIARMFGICLPLNFASPYKSLNIIEFWRRWHITLSRFLRDYVYFSLGGNRKGKFRRYFNLLITMLLGGLWHGAGWTFIFWGGLHGLYLIINHSWLYIKNRFNLVFLDTNKIWLCFAWVLTFISVVNGWVLFRAESISDALVMFKGMYGFNGIALPNAIYTRLGGLKTIFENFGIESYIGGGSQFIFTYGWLFILLSIILFLPNTQQFMRRHIENKALGPALFDQGILKKTLVFEFSLPWAIMLPSILVLAIFGLNRVSEFLYFQF